MTRCGDANEYVSAGVHAALVCLYSVMLVFHFRSTTEHWGRARKEGKR